MLHVGDSAVDASAGRVKAGFLLPQLAVVGTSPLLVSSSCRCAAAPLAAAALHVPLQKVDSQAAGCSRRRRAIAGSSAAAALDSLHKQGTLRLLGAAGAGARS